MIVYFDTSAIVPLVVAEGGSAAASNYWSEAETVVSVRLVLVEARAALAQAHRAKRLTTEQFRKAKIDLDPFLRHLDLVEVDAALAQLAGDLAELYALRGYDAVHLAAAMTVPNLDLFVAGDKDLLDAARVEGIAVADLAA